MKEPTSKRTRRASGRPPKKRLDESDAEFIESLIDAKFASLSDFYDHAYKHAKALDTFPSHLKPSDVSTVKDAYRFALGGKRSLPKIYWKVLEEMFSITRDNLPSRLKPSKGDAVDSLDMADTETPQNTEVKQSVVPLSDLTVEQADITGNRHMRRGIYQMRNGDLKDAVGSFNKAIAILPSNVFAYYQRGCVQVAIEEYAKALEDFIRVIALDAKCFEAYCKSYFIMMVMGNLEGALANLEKAIELEPQNELAIMYRSFLKGRMGDKKGAASDYKIAFELNPSVKKVIYGTWDILLSKGDCSYPFPLSRVNLVRPSGYKHNLSSKVIPAVFALPPPGDPTLDTLNNAIKSNQQNANAFHERALHFKSINEFAKALKDVNTAIALKNDNAAFYFTSGSIKYALRDNVGSLEDYNRAIFLSPTNGSYYSRRGDVRTANGDIDGAIVDYDKSLELDPSNLDCLQKRAGLKRKRGDAVGAIADLTTAIEQDPFGGVCYAHRARIKSEMGDDAGALEDISTQVELSSGSYFVYLERGNLHYICGNFKAAILDYGKTLERDPKNISAYINRGNARLVSGDHEGSISDYNCAIKHHPKCAVGYFSRATYKKGKCDYDGAFNDFMIAYECMLKQPSVMREVIERAFRETFTALVECNRAIKDNPKNETAYFIRSYLRDAKGDVNGAISDIEMAIKIKIEQDVNSLFLGENYRD